MKIVIAPDSFKGNMRSATVCEIIREAVWAEMPEAEVVMLPMADGGEGTVDAVVEAAGGCVQSLEVTGPLGGTVSAEYGILPDGTAVMEMASASGIELVGAERLNPMEATTYGTGELLRHLIAAGRTSIVMGIGGSATVDGGTGMAQALGVRFRTPEGMEIRERGGKILPMIGSVDMREVIPELEHTRIRVACDVTNPLTGANGAAAVFGPQKGATPEMVMPLDAGLSNLRKVVGTPEAPGDGAAGGLGYGLRAFCGAEIVSGAHLIAETVGLPRALEGADLLITGEGRTDGQSLSGKLCPVLAGQARERGVKSLLVSGALFGVLDPFLDVFDYAFSISAGHSSMADCIKYAPADLRFLIRNVMRILSNS
ncbi:glycerate kinase [Pontiella agarivorans]|uniref:Glycerate kinase n=1 Tax=Pontiella agarivorans TaxID=3038953 RepID=A0ABU5MZP9_9BACT|nr:glycerate kinase [Pontiella agarivorans]MDZ8119660.1 glycerate kinase [Pontiella agarivorans]